MKNKSTYTLWRMYRYYNKRRRVSKIILNIMCLLIFIGFFLIIGTTGSIDLDAIPFKQALIQYLIGISLVAIPVHYSSSVEYINENAIYRLKQIEKILDERKRQRANKEEINYGYTASY